MLCTPRVWGRHGASDLPGQVARNTPTCVGKTRRRFRHRRHEWKHPHMCGEDPIRVRHSQRPAETPPHVWGRPATSSPSNTATGNTPTCVGKTARICAFPGQTRKHPHMCGEDTKRSLNFFSPYIDCSEKAKRGIRLYSVEVVQGVPSSLGVAW